VTTAARPWPPRSHSTSTSWIGTTSECAVCSDGYASSVPCDRHSCTPWTRPPRKFKFDLFVGFVRCIALAACGVLVCQLDPHRAMPSCLFAVKIKHVPCVHSACPAASRPELTSSLAFTWRETTVRACVDTCLLAKPSLQLRTEAVKRGLRGVL
jgi:hypothetical protein